MQLNLDIGYSNHIFYKNLTLEIPSQGIISIIGGNGSGKSTLYKTIMGIIPPIRGKIPLVLKKKCAIVSDYVHAPEENNVKDLLNLVTSTEGTDSNKYPELYSYFSNLANTKVKYLSSGQKRILEIFLVLLSGKTIIILDEASNALDFENKDLFFHYVKKLSSQGILFFHTSHDLSEVLSLTKEIYFLDKSKGELVPLITEQPSIEDLTILIRKNGV